MTRYTGGVMKVEEIFSNYFMAYCEETGKKKLRYVVTSRDRKGNVASNPHALPGNAIDFTLRSGPGDKDYSPITEYNNLFAHMMNHWPFRAGIDNTPHRTRKDFPGNVHIHIDLGENRPVYESGERQAMPYFFKEDNGKFQYQIIRKEQIA